MTKPNFTPRSVAKFVVKSAVAVNVSNVARTVISDHTSAEKDAIPVQFAGGVVGWYASEHFETTTDRLVDFVADKIAAHRAKNAESNTTQ